MIKIIKSGTKRNAECDKCGCVFSYEEEDIKHLERHSDISSTSFTIGCNFVSGAKPGYVKYVICPQCNYGNVVIQTKEIKKDGDWEKTVQMPIDGAEKEAMKKDANNGGGELL